jgi:predicted nucleic acid-binding protein
MRSNLLFYDTWSYLAIADKRDPYHELAQERAKVARQRGLQQVTSTYIFAESVTSVRSRAGHDVAVWFGEMFRNEVAKGVIDLVQVTQDHVDQAWQLFRRYRTLRRLSFIDCTSFVVMRERGIKYVFTGDTHFEQVNLGFQIFKG